MSASFRALATPILVDIAEDLPFADLVRALISTYAATDADPELRYSLRRHELSRDGTKLQTIADPRDLAPLFELDLYEQVIARAPAGWLLHAAALEIGDGAVVFAGPSGAGKTTLTLELIARGYRLLTEEIVWIDERGNTRGLARPLHVLEDELPRVPATWRRVLYPVRATDNRERMLVVPPGEVYQHGSLPLRALVRLTHGPDREPGLARLHASDALPRFWDPTLRPDDPGLRVATTTLRDVPAYRLASRTLAEALACLQELLTQPAG